MNTQNKAFEIAPGIKVGDRKKLLLISGPCQIESLEHCLMIAEELKKLCSNKPINLIFKASFDKANRSSLAGKRGPGIEEGLKILAEVKSRTGLPILTDIHAPEQVQAVAEVVDILQTPAFLCRQTDLLLAAGASNKTVQIKKGQFLAPEDMQQVAEKAASTGNHKLLLCERGTCFGYRDLVVDMRSLVLMKKTGYPVIFDATHSVQIMGGAATGESRSSGGRPEFTVPLSKAALAVGVDGIFAECHDNPQKAPSDGSNMLPLSQMGEYLEVLVKFWEVAKS